MDNNVGATRVTTPAGGRVVVRGGLETKEEYNKTGRLTAEALRSLNPSGLSACGGRRPAASHSSGETLYNSCQHSSRSLNNNAVGIFRARNGASKRPSHGVRFSSGMDVITECDRRLAQREPRPRRGGRTGHHDDHARWRRRRVRGGGPCHGAPQTVRPGPPFV
ncbi:unnamed protein product [Ectocarpus sp. 4 AP-2014]